MKFLVMVKASAESEAGVMPSQRLFSEMGKFNEELERAGALVDLAGLKPSSQGARVQFTGSRRTIVDGPFAETKELVAGFWIIECGSLQEAKDWMLRCPNPHEHDGEIEIRPFYELSDFENLPEEVTAMAERQGEAR